MAPRFLHVANGSSVTGTLRAAGVPGIMSLWCDPLHQGPVPGGLSDEDLRSIRGQYLGGGHDDPMLDMGRWRKVIADRDAYDELVLWFEHDLFDQLNLIQLLSWIKTHNPAPTAASLICIGSFPGRPSFKGLGELTSEELTSLLGSRRPVTHAEYELAERAWEAFRESTPEDLDDFRRADTSAMPFLSAALGRFLQDYPWAADGLSRTERRLLQIAGTGPIAMNGVFPRMHEGEDAYYVADLELKDLVETLSRTSPSLISFSGESAGRAFWRGTVELTDAGREVLAGHRDRVACGIDKWLGGVHLKSGDGVIWRWDDHRRRVTPS